MLMLCPTRELAVQVAEEVARLAAVQARGARGADLRRRELRAAVCGLRRARRSSSARRDESWTIWSESRCRSRRVAMVVLDEADRMLDMGFRDDMEPILSKAKPDAADGALLRHTSAGDPADDCQFTREPARAKIEEHAS